MQVDDDHIGDRSAAPGQFGEAHRAHRALRAAGTLVAADADCLPRAIVGRPGQVGLVAGLGRTRPLDQALDVDLGGRRELLDLQLALTGGGCLQLAYPLHADVVAAAFQHGPVERAAEVRFEKRQVLGRQLILQGLGGCGDDDVLAGQDCRDEVAERLARAGTRLDDQMPAMSDCVVDRCGHLLLAGPLLGRRQCCGDLCKGRGHVVRFGHEPRR